MGLLDLLLRFCFDTIVKFSPYLIRILRLYTPNTFLQYSKIEFGFSQIRHLSSATQSKAKQSKGPSSKETKIKEMMVVAKINHMNIFVSKLCELPLLGFPASSNLGLLQVNNSSNRRRQKLNYTAPFVTGDNLASTSTITPTKAGWAEFGEKVSGEWDGYGADFTVEGKPIELPESVVPEAYREWDVKVFDWQTQCPTTTHQQQSSPSSSSSSPSSLFYKTIRLLPTVGCEADAATTYTILERNSDLSRAFAYHSTTGSYVSLWPHFNKSVLELEHCLIDPLNKESRVRVIQVLDSHQQQELWKLELKSISVFVEQWYGPFRNGEQLGGCGLRESAFATTQPLEASQVSGNDCVWEGLTAVATFPNSQSQMLELGDEREFKSTRRDDEGLILLPKNLWCSLKRLEDNTTSCEVGWLLDQGRRAITSKCTFSNSSTFMVKEIALTCENVTSKLY